MFLHIERGFFTEKLDQRCLCLTFEEMKDVIRFFTLPDTFASRTMESAIVYTAQGPLKDILAPGNMAIAR